MKYPSAAPQPVETFPIKCDDSNSFNIVIQLPNFQQRFDDEDRKLRGNLRAHRLASCCQGWDLVDDNGNPKPYSIYALHTVIDAYPSVLDQLNAIIDPLFDAAK